MSLQSFIDSIESDQTFSERTTTQKKVVYLLEKLHKIKNNIEYLDGDTIEKCLDQASLRYREVKLGSKYDAFDFGVILIVRQNLHAYNILSRIEGKPECMEITGNELRVIPLDDSLLELKDEDMSYEVYPSLPYSVRSISEFLSFTFNVYISDVASLVFYTVLSQAIKAAFPLITVYVATTVVSLGSIELTWAVGIFTISLSLFATASLYIQARIIQKLESESDKRAQSSVWDRLMKIDLSYILPYKPADLVSRAASISQVRTLMSSQNITSFIGLLFSLIYLVEMYIYLPLPTLSVLPLLLVFGIIVVNKSKSGGALLSGSLTSNAELTDLSNTILKGLPEFRTSNSLNNMTPLWYKILNNSALFAYRYRLKDNTLEVLSSTFMPLSFLVSFATIITFDSVQLTSPSFLANAIGYSSALTIFGSTLMAGTVSIVNSLINVLAYWKRAEPIVFSPIESGYNTSCYPISIEGDVEVANIYFKYSEDLPNVLSNFNLSIKKGNINTLHINSGSGTTTFFRLLLGLYPDSQGSIFYDGHKLDNILISSLRSQVKLAPQGLNIPIGNIYRLFRGPLSNDNEMLTEFIKAMGLDKFIESLRMGIDTPLGNNGKSFPQKQRQLLSLAYAISQAPKLLLVDNCLSELSFDEKVPIFRFALSKGMTIILSDVDSDALATLIN